jgi:hypothetical protein
MKRLAALLTIAVAFGAMFLTSAAGAREPTEIEKCQTISHPGSYKLVNNLTFSGSPFGACLVITANFVTIDLAGFSITSGPTGILALPPSGRPLRGIAVRNGSISDSFVGVDLGSAIGSIVEGLILFPLGGPGTGIIANGIVKGNVAGGAGAGSSGRAVIEATGIVTGNYVLGSRNVGISIGEGSTVIGNTVTGAFFTGMVVSCPSNVTDNTAVGNGRAPVFPNLVLNGDGCNNTNNVAP